MIDLAEPRVIPIPDRGHLYTLTIAPISKKHWLEYFAAIESTSETIEGKRTDSFDSSAARLELVQKTLVRAEGYRTAAGQAVMDLPGWQTLIPLAHRMAAGAMLTAVERSGAKSEEPIMLGFETVSLDATWGWDGSAAMTRTLGLLHVFGSPTVEQQRRYSRDMSRSQIIGGSRTGKTRWLGAQATLVALYDELITAVQGYAGLDFDNPDHEAVVRTMDTYHKVAAAEALFSPATPELAEAK